MPSNEQLYFDALRVIAKDYQTTAQLRKRSERDYGLGYHEALEMAYENIQMLAASVTRGKRRPPAPTPDPAGTRDTAEGHGHG